MHEPERRQREPLDHHLHAEVGHVPAAVGDDVVEQHLEVRVDRVVTRQLRVEVAREHLDVTGLVHHLGRRVVLGVDPRNGLDDLGGADERTLLAVHELREGPVLGLDPEVDPLLVAPVLEGRALRVHAFLVQVRVRRLVGLDHFFLVHVGVPRQVGARVPLRRLGLLVELVQRGAALLVVPREDGIGVGTHRVRDFVDIGVGDREDRLDVVDLGAADEVLVVDGHGTTP